MCSDGAIGCAGHAFGTKQGGFRHREGCRIRGGNAVRECGADAPVGHRVHARCHDGHGR